MNIKRKILQRKYKILIKRLNIFPQNTKIKAKFLEVENQIRNSYKNGNHCEKDKAVHKIKKTINISIAMQKELLHPLKL